MEAATAFLNDNHLVDVVQQPTNFYGCHVIIEIRRVTGEKKADGGE
jgi:hypothetical protein